MRYVGIGLLLALAIVGCQKKDKEPKGKPPQAVEAVRVEQSKIVRQIKGSSTARGIRESYVVSETQGKIRKVNFNLGQKVRKGLLLVQVDAAIQREAYEQAKQAAATAKMSLESMQRLHEEGDASQAELIGAQSQASGALAALESTQKAYKDCWVRSPISGHVAQKDASLEVGNLLAPGTMVARIVDISRLKTIISVGQMEVGLLKKGLGATITVPAAENQVFKGIVTGVAAGSDPLTGSYPVEVVWKNSKDRSVKSGMTVQVLVQTKAQVPTILIPADAVAEVDRKDAVFVAADSVAAVRFVKIGRISGDLVEVVEGLESGDILITSGIKALSRGSRIRVTMTNEAGVAP